MRNSTNFVTTSVKASQVTEETIWLLPGAVIGFSSWLLVLDIAFLVYGLNTLLLFLYTWPFFLALMPMAVVIGIALHSLLRGKLVFSCFATLFAVALIFSALFTCLMG